MGSVTPNGSTTVSPAQTTTYTLTATSADGKSVTAPITITVATGNIPQVVVFVATPQNIDAGSSTKLCWQVTGATQFKIDPGVGSNLNANDCATVSPTADHHLHPDRDQLDRPDPGQRDGQRGPGADHVVHGRPGDLDGAGNPVPVLDDANATCSC